VEPEAGLVIRYDFLWRTQRDAGAELGSKDRPSAVVLVARPTEDGSRRVVVCPITHAPPTDGQSAVAIPVKVARHLGLDDHEMWIKTDTVNLFTWEAGKIPFGVTPASRDQWPFGMLPQQIGKAVFEQVMANSRDRSLYQVDRDISE